MLTLTHGPRRADAFKPSIASAIGAAKPNATTMMPIMQRFGEIRAQTEALSA
jgi:hypothetical protein